MKIIILNICQLVGNSIVEGLITYFVITKQTIDLFQIFDWLEVFITRTAQTSLDICQIIDNNIVTGFTRCNWDADQLRARKHLPRYKNYLGYMSVCR